MRFSFKCEQESSKSVEVKTNEVDVHEVLNDFVSFLKGCGYHEKSIINALVTQQYNLDLDSMEKFYQGENDE